MKKTMIYSSIQCPINGFIEAILIFDAEIALYKDVRNAVPGRKA
jgi:hypothetical protein